MKKIINHLKAIYSERPVIGTLHGILFFAVLAMVICALLPTPAVHGETGAKPVVTTSHIQSNRDYPNPINVTRAERSTEIGELETPTLMPRGSKGWRLRADRYIRLSMGLPDDIEYLTGHIEVTYPSVVPAGDQGTISVKVYSQSNSTIYSSETVFEAVDDLSLGCGLRDWIGVANFEWGDGTKNSGVTIPIYTSCAGRYKVVTKESSQCGEGYSVTYKITPFNVPNNNVDDCAMANRTVRIAVSGMNNNH